MRRGRGWARCRTDGQTDRKRESGSVSLGQAYRWPAAAACSPAAQRLPAALSASPAGVGPPRSRSCPSTTGSPVNNTAHLLKNRNPRPQRCTNTHTTRKHRAQELGRVTLGSTCVGEGLFLNTWLCPPESLKEQTNFCSWNFRGWRDLIHTHKHLMLIEQKFTCFCCFYVCWC